MRSPPKSGSGRLDLCETLPEISGLCGLLLDVDLAWQPVVTFCVLTKIMT